MEKPSTYEGFTWFYDEEGNNIAGQTDGTIRSSEEEPENSQEALDNAADTVEYQSDITGNREELEEGYKDPVDEDWVER